MSSPKDPKEKPKEPLVTPELLQWLEHLYPDKSPKPEDSERTIWINVGHVEVVKHLRRLKDKQEQGSVLLSS